MNTPQLSPASGGDRNIAVDVLRLVGVGEIIIFHVDVSHGWLLLGFGLPTLLILTNVFVDAAHERKVEYTRVRAR